MMWWGKSDQRYIEFSVKNWKLCGHFNTIPFFLNCGVVLAQILLLVAPQRRLLVYSSGASSLERVIYSLHQISQIREWSENMIWFDIEKVGVHSFVSVILFHWTKLFVTILFVLVQIFLQAVVLSLINSFIFIERVLSLFHLFLLQTEMISHIFHSILPAALKPTSHCGTRLHEIVIIRVKVNLNAYQFFHNLDTYQETLTWSWYL